jgi:hypothetical protein
LKITTPPVIDGKLDESVWTKVKVVSDFIQRFPKDGDLPTERTEVYIMYTATDLFVGVRCFDSQPEKIVATVMQRDNFDLIQNEQFVISIDSYNDERNGYWFSTNPLGVRVDAQFFNEGDIWISDWDGIWDCQSRINSFGWSTEIKIPFSTLRFDRKDKNIMGINLFRRIIRTNEEIFSPHIPLQYSYGTPNVSAARKYIFDGIKGGKNLHVQPYILGGYQKENLETHSSVAIKKEIGGDIRYNVTDNLTANLTYNTDFAQVELDDRQINLTRFNLFFSEKRDFFLENAGLFSFGLPQEIELFFSRTVGLAQDAINRTTSVPILFGSKLTGRAGKFELGLMNVQTRSKDAIPWENSSVVRVRFQVLPRSYIGMIATNKFTENNIENNAFGMDANIYLSEDTGISGFVSTIDLPRGNFGNLSSSAFNVTFFKKGEKTSFNLALSDIGSEFNPAMGFISRSDIRKWNGTLRLPWYIESTKLRRLVPEYEATYYVNYSGKIENSVNNISFQIEMQSNDVFNIYASRVFEYVPFEFPVFKSIMISNGNYTTYRSGVSLKSKQGRKFFTNLILESGGLYDGTQTKLITSLQWKVNRYLTIFQNYETSWVSFINESFRTQIVQSRINYALNTKFFINSLIQYDNESEELGLNLRFHYQFREGRELFLVYNEIFREENNRFANTLNQSNYRVIILKLNYMFNF